MITSAGNSVDWSMADDGKGGWMGGLLGLLSPVSLYVTQA